MRQYLNEKRLLGIPSSVCQVSISLVYNSKSQDILGIYILGGFHMRSWEPGQFVMMHWCRAAQQQRSWDPALEEPPIHPRMFCTIFSKLFQCKIYFQFFQSLKAMPPRGTGSQVIAFPAAAQALGSGPNPPQADPVPGCPQLGLEA